MNENPEGTPNPLNPNPGAAPMGTEPVAPAPEPMPKEQPVLVQKGLVFLLRIVSFYLFL